jgi:hypothetical protein
VTGVAVSCLDPPPVAVIAVLDRSESLVAQS